MAKQKLPKWFQGELYKKGETVTNPFSGQSYELTAEELSMYDFIMGASQLAEMGLVAPKNVDDMRKGLMWFRKNNPEAYMVLLD
mgnify:CR=1 FL=1|tara:strand:+ start:179 stop:430 length:252 start_codon:yes stop_codon:yes gene_type:complete